MSKDKYSHTTIEPVHDGYKVTVHSEKHWWAQEPFATLWGAKRWEKKMKERIANSTEES